MKINMQFILLSIHISISILQLWISNIDLCIHQILCYCLIFILLKTFRWLNFILEVYLMHLKDSFSKVHYLLQYITFLVRTKGNHKVSFESVSIIYFIEWFRSASLPRQIKIFHPTRFIMFTISKIDTQLEMMRLFL